MHRRPLVIVPSSPKDACAVRLKPLLLTISRFLERSCAEKPISCPLGGIPQQLLATPASVRDASIGGAAGGTTEIVGAPRPTMIRHLHGSAHGQHAEAYEKLGSMLQKIRRTLALA